MIFGPDGDSAAGQAGNGRGVVASVQKDSRDPAAGRGQGNAVTAEAVADIFRSVLELDSIQPDDNFFRLGGDSLLAETLMTALEAAFGVALPISVLVEAPTPRKLAGSIGRRNAAGETSNLMVVRAAGERMPLLCVHGTDGDSLTSSQLADAMRSEREIHAYRAIGLAEGERPLVSIEAMAEAYIAEYRPTEGPDRPILLLGHCAGSMVAYEMAQRLTAAGRKVAGLVLIDPEVGKNAPFLYNPVRATVRRSVEETRLRLWQGTAAAGGAGTTPEERRRSTRKAMNFAVRRYVPEPLELPCLLLFTPARRALVDPRRGYPALLPDCEFIEIDAVHDKLFTRHVDELARAIERFFERVEPVCAEPKRSVPA